MTKPLIILTISLLFCSCAPQREFITFGDAGTFHPGPEHSSGKASGPDGEYDSYELIDHGAPNAGVPPMYSGQNAGGYNEGGYPRTVKTYDQYGPPQTVIIPNPW